MSHKLAAAFAATAVLALAAPAWAAVPAYVTAAVADPARPETDTKRDADRKPADMLVFMGLKPGDKVVDMATGAKSGVGYFAKLFSTAVGPTGVVYAYEPSEFAQFYKSPLPASGSHPDPKRTNVTYLMMPLNEFATPQKVDIVWTAQNYHDFHDGFSKPADLALINKAIYASLKPGGLYVVLDHAAADGSGLRDTDTLHRIDPAQLRKEIEAAGFKFVAESKVLRNPADPRTANVYDASIKGHTDQFIYKFRKPA